MSTYCAPCLADLALVREAVTSVSGTAACVAHAVLLTHPHDNPQRRLTRLSDLRAMAEGKLATASAEDVPAIELLVQEYALAGAMDMTVPLKELAGDRTPRPPKTRNRGRGRDGRPEGRPGGERPGGERQGGERPGGERPGGEREPRPEQGAAGGEQGAPEGGANLVTGTATAAEPPSATPAPAWATPEVSGAEGAPAPSRPDSSPAESPAPQVSGAEGAPTRSEPDSSAKDSGPAPAPSASSPAPDAPAPAPAPAAAAPASAAPDAPAPAPAAAAPAPAPAAPGPAPVEAPVAE